MRRTRPDTVGPPHGGGRPGGPAERTAAAAAAEGAMTGDKIRLRFAKAGDLRLLSHLDLLRASERMLRRAELPFKSTQGFHPMARWVFALSLPLGVGGRNEVVELELLEPRDCEIVRETLNRHAPPGLVFHAAAAVPMKAVAMARRAVYTLALPADRVAAATDAAAAFMAQDKVWVDKLHPRPRKVNVRPYLRSMRVENATLIMDCWVTPTGTARGDDLLKLLGLADVHPYRAVLERAELEISDEVGETDDGPPTGPPETLPLNHVPAQSAGDSDTPAAATWGLSPNGPVTE